MRIADVDVAHQLAERPGRLDERAAPPLRVDLERVVAPVGQVQVGGQPAAVGVRAWHPSADRPRGRVRPAPGSAGRRRRTAAPARTTAANSPAFAGVPGCRGRRRAAPGAPGTCLRPGRRRPLWVPSSPWGCAARSRASAAGRERTGAGGPGLVPDRADARVRLVERRGDVAVHLVDVAAGDLEHLVAVGVQQAAARPRDRCARAPSDWRSCTSSGAGSAGRRRRGAGLRKRVPFHDPSSGPVSASPSPTTQATSRSGLSMAAPNAWISE